MIPALLDRDASQLHDRAIECEALTCVNAGEAVESFTEGGCNNNKSRVMQVPLKISFRNMRTSPTIAARIQQKAAKLERFCDRIIGCHVIVEAPHRRQRKGRLYNLRIDLTVPGRAIVVERAGAADHAHEHIQAAMRDAFDAAQRRLEDYVREARA
jgi:ribosome-associated translation inhibitor RaiA